MQVSLSAFAFLFSELVQYNQGRVENIAELEHRLGCNFSSLKSSTRGFNLDIASLHLLTTNNITVCKSGEPSFFIFTSFK